MKPTDKNATDFLRAKGLIRDDRSAFIIRWDSTDIDLALMLNEYVATLPAPEPAPVVNAGRKAQIIREALITCRDSIKGYLQQQPPLYVTEDLLKPFRAKLQEYNELIAEISGYKPKQDEADPDAPYLLHFWDTTYSRYSYVSVREGIEEAFDTTDPKQATKFPTKDIAIAVAVKYKFEQYEPVSLSVFNSYNQ